MTWSALAGVLAVCCATATPGVFAETGCTEADCSFEGCKEFGPCWAAAPSESNNKAICVQRVMGETLFPERLIKRLVCYEAV
jgi:hypothetical protein